MKIRMKFVFLVCVVVFTLGIAVSCSASDLSTFESFYKKSAAVGWIVGGAVALACGAAVYFTGGLASPVVAGPIAWVGGLIGGTMGLSGAAATSAGLAFFGGGAVTAGGLGMAGGIALLTAIFTFSSGAIVDYGIGKVMAEYSYYELQEQAKKLPNLPPFINSDGPSVISNAVGIFERNYDNAELPGSEKNQKICLEVKEELKNYKRLEKHFYTLNYEQKVSEELVRLYSADAIVEFMLNDYKLAYASANNALKVQYDGKLTVAKNIASSTGLIIGEIDKELSAKYFVDSIINEPDNKLILLLFSMYVSRVGSANLLDADLLENISFAVWSIESQEMNESVRQFILTSYLSKIKLCQSNIVTINKYIKDGDFDVEKMQKRSSENFLQYKELILNAKKFIGESLKSKNSDDSKKIISNSIALLGRYENDIQRLEGLNNETRDVKNEESVMDKLKKYLPSWL